MTQAMQDLLVSYTKARESEEISSVRVKESGDERWRRDEVRLKETRARFFDAIERLEREAK